MTDLNTGESIHVSDMKIGEGVEVHEAPESVVVSIVMVKEEELEPQLEAAEPELVDEKGKEDEGDQS